MHRLHVGAAALTAAALLALGVPASAHVKASSDNAVRGGYATITFTVPTEKDDASTVGLVVQMPTDTPLASVSVQPVPGWSFSAPTRKLATPVSTDDGPVSEAVSEITWRATGGGVGPGQFQQFVISAGPLPDRDSITFKAIQTYSDRSTVAWIETPAPGSTAEPEHPAPVLPIAASATTSSSPSSVTSAPAATFRATAAAAPGTDHGLSVAALVVAILAALVAAGTALTVVRGSRRGRGGAA